MSALYFSMSRDQASSLPERHSLTKRSSLHALEVLFDALVSTGVIGWDSPRRCESRVAQRSRGRRALKRQDGGWRWNFLRRPECQDLPGISWVDSRRESLARDRRVFCAGHSPP